VVPRRGRGDAAGRVSLPGRHDRRRRAGRAGHRRDVRAGGRGGGRRRPRPPARQPRPGGAGPPPAGPPPVAAATVARVVTALHAREGLPPAEVARILGKPEPEIEALLAGPAPGSAGPGPPGCDPAVVRAAL